MSKTTISPFSCSGECAGIYGKSPDRPKLLHLVTASGDRLALELAKPVRGQAALLVPGDRVEVSGKQTVDERKGSLTRKVTSLQSPRLAVEAPVPAGVAKSQKPERVLVCQKSSCCKRGGKQVFAALNEAVAARGLQDRVAVKATGCMDQCKRGPVVVFRNDKARYLGVSADSAGNLLDEHVPPEGPAAARSPESAAPAR